MSSSTDRSLYRRLARASGESVRTLRRLGFQIVPNVALAIPQAEEEGSFDRAPLFVDWDALDDRFGVAVRPLARAS